MDIVTVGLKVLLALLGADPGTGNTVLDAIDERAIDASSVEVVRTIVAVVAGAGHFECVPRLPDERQPEQMPCEDLRMARGSPLRR